MCEVITVASEMHAHTVFFELLNVSNSGVPERQSRPSYDTELMGIQESGHRAQLNLWTKRCSSLMTQRDLPVRA